MSEYTPTTADIRADYYPNAGGDRAEEHAEFDRWLAAHDREVAARAWGEGASWAAVECGAISDERQAPAFLANGDNPYRAEASRLREETGR